MAATLEDIAKQAVHLPPNQRMALAGFLLELDSPSADSEVEQAWEEEIAARILAVDFGSVAGVPYSEVIP